ncbi:hypothetical protein PCYB_093810 [Plasmodium cynomolgi strain B]|uniref:RNA-binding protein n=1 Tax=Plasmodium cynomolgi (strain B) TaxID=1120755 RepID=K6UDH2_PLACD|nr:hypothetical protein PCYB_093810 [Plasmodium cynomolgi strain B]GAB66596.1 hypothetical protein PCYB_093810 [Plasmodium cynomolgi strain B]
MESDNGVNTTPLRDNPEETKNQVNDTLPIGKHIKLIEKLKINSISTGVDSHRSSEKSTSNQINLGENIQYAPCGLSKKYNERDDVVETLTSMSTGRAEQGDHSTETNAKVNYKLNVLSLGQYPLEGDHLESQPISGRYPNCDTHILGKNIANDFPHISDTLYKPKKDKLRFKNIQKVATSHMEKNYNYIWGDDNILPCEYNLEQFGVDIYGAMEANLCGEYAGGTFVEEAEKKKEKGEPTRGEGKRNDALESTKQHSWTENRDDKQAVEDNRRGRGARGTNRVGSSGGDNPDWGITYSQNGLAEMTLSPHSTAADLLTSFFPPPGRSHLLGREAATSSLATSLTTSLTTSLATSLTPSLTPPLTHVGKLEAPLSEEILQQALNENYYYDLRTNQVWVPRGDAGGNDLGASEGEEGLPTREEATHGMTIRGESTPVAASIRKINDHGLSLLFGIFPNECEVVDGFDSEGRTRTPKSEDPDVKMVEDTNVKMVENPNVNMMEDPFLKMAQDALFTKGMQEFPLLDDHMLLPFYAHHGNTPVQEKEVTQRGTFIDEEETYMQYMLGEFSILDQLGAHHKGGKEGKQGMAGKEEEMTSGRIDNGGNQSVSPNSVQFERRLRENYEEDHTALQTGDNWGNVEMGNNTNLTRLTQLEETLLSQRRNLFEVSPCETEGVDLTSLCNLGGENRWGEKRQDGGEAAHSYHFAYPMSRPYEDNQPNVYVDRDLKNMASEPNSYDYWCEEGNQKDNHYHEENVMLSKRLSKSLAKYTLIVNVPSNTTRKDLLAVFSKFGNVDLTMVVCDKKSRHPNKEWTATSGYAFVRFSTNLEAQRTLNAACAGGIRIRGSRVRATWAKKDSYSKREKEITFKIPSSILLINIDEFICSICKINLSYEPILFPCCYSSCCSDCLRGYLIVHAVGENIECPSCSLHLSDGLIKIDEHSSGVMGLLYKIHSNVKIKCQNENCKWVGFQHQYVNHFFSCKFGLA